jgi:hypothetical protein
MDPSSRTSLRQSKTVMLMKALFQNILKRKLTRGMFVYMAVAIIPIPFKHKRFLYVPHVLTWSKFEFLSQNIFMFHAVLIINSDYFSQTALRRWSM